MLWFLSTKYSQLFIQKRPGQRITPAPAFSGISFFLLFTPTGALS